MPDTAATMLQLVGGPERSILNRLQDSGSPSEQGTGPDPAFYGDVAFCDQGPEDHHDHPASGRPATVSTSDADDCLSIAQINYLLQTRQIDDVILADTTMISLDGLRAHLERHVGYDPDERPCWMSPGPRCLRLGDGSSEAAVGKHKHCRAVSRKAGRRACCGVTARAPAPLDRCDTATIRGVNRETRTTVHRLPHGAGSQLLGVGERLACCGPRPATRGGPRD